MRKKIVPVILFGLVGLHLLFFAVTLKRCLWLRTHNPETTNLIRYRLRTGTPSVKPILFVPLGEIPGGTRRMLITSEDLHFYSHWGIDIPSIIAAWSYNRKAGKPVLGASTIPQQVTRTLFLTPVKTILRKYLEALGALEMDFLLSKKRILELYFNYSEWGNGIFGIGQAARSYYGKAPSDLTQDESSRLIAVLASPLRFTPDTVESSPSLANRYFLIKFTQAAFQMFAGPKND